MEKMLEVNFEKNNNSWKTVFGIVFALAFVLFLHGAVPFFSVPTLGGAIWTTGFSQSFINESIYSIYAKNFGIPEPAAIAFGLAGAYPAGLLIAAGLHPADAYSAMAAMWLCLAFFGAWRIGHLFELRPLLVILGAVLWLSMPIIWAHAGYSMLSMGIGLLPFYFWAALGLFFTPQAWHRIANLSAGVYVVACLIAVFMDGYSFMMFAVGSSLLGVYLFVTFPERRRHLMVFGFPVHLLGFGLAYIVYSAYIVKPQFDPAPLDFFRGWGLDLTFLVIPTQGIHWLWDTLGWSVPRSDQEFFGDVSVWVTTFSLPIIIAGAVAWWATRRRLKLASGFLLIALFGFYMALGPSLKVNSTKPMSLPRLMPAELAIAPTGNAWLSENIPGFNNMRAAYRWSALGVFGSWVLFMVLLGRTDRHGRIWIAVALGAMIISNLPHLQAKWMSDKANRNMFFHIDADLVSDMAGVLQKGELVAFLPYRNDFLVNYLAPRLDICTYNIGGDKNLDEARKHWPKTMQLFQMRQIDAGFTERVLLLLARHEADAVVLPYIGMLMAAYEWPRPPVFKEELTPVIADLKASGSVSVNERKYYAVVRAKSRDEENAVNHCRSLVYPITVAQQTVNLRRVLGAGWHAPESEHVWSGSRAELSLPVPDNCPPGQCGVVLTFWVFGASKNRPVSVMFHTNAAGVQSPPSLTISSPDKQLVTIPLAAGQPTQTLSIEVPEAISPKDLQDSADLRVLGIALHSIELVRSKTGVNEQAPEDGGGRAKSGSY